jgi:hypothetical protein
MKPCRRSRYLRAANLTTALFLLAVALSGLIFNSNEVFNAL